MVRIEDAVIARLKKGEHTFEVLVDCEKAIEFKQGKDIPISDILAVENIFKDAHKGDVAANLKENFGTEDIDEIAKEIIKEGEIQLTTEYKRKLTEEKREEVAKTIARMGMDPKTKLPIPLNRVKLAMEEARVHIDPFKSTKVQMEEVVNKLRPILPITFEKKKYNVFIPATHAAHVYGVLKKYGKLIKEEWTATGGLRVTLEMPAGLSDEFIDAINKITHGDVEITDATA